MIMVDGSVLTLLDTPINSREEYDRKLTVLKNEYVAMRKKFQELHTPFTIKLYFSKPNTLHYSRKLRDDKTALIHEVNDLFFTDKQGLANCEHDRNAEAHNAYYKSGRQRYSGYYLSIQSLQRIEFVTANHIDHRKEWERIAKSMRKYQINLEIADEIEKGIAGLSDCNRGYCKDAGLSIHHTHFSQNELDMKKDKPKIADFSEILERVTGHSGVVPGVSYPVREYEKLRKNHIKDLAIEKMIKYASKSEYGDYKFYSISKSGLKRDKSVSMQIYPDGKIRYYAASEYVGCGNGDYYLMFNPIMAFYTETD